MPLLEQTRFPVAARVLHQDRGLGVIEAVQGKNIRVRFDGEAETMLYNPLSAPIGRLVWEIGEEALISNLNSVGVVQRIELRQDLALYHVQLPQNSETVTVPEAGLSPAPDLEMPDELLAAGRFGLPKSFYFRTIGHYLNSARQQIGAYGLAARIEPKPHQAFVAHRVVNAPQPRFLLADEVGLGKTIETGLILQELRARGGLERVLIVVPTNLALQWLFELHTKFNESFKLFDKRAVVIQEQAKYPGANIWEVGRNVITTHSYITNNQKQWEDIANVPWDMVVFDEAHHVRRQRDSKGSPSANALYRFASQISQRTRGLLLLTATPMQLDPFELFSLVELLDPALFFSYDFFAEQIDQNRVLNRTITQVTEFVELSAIDRLATLQAVRSLLPELDAGLVANVATSQRARDEVVDALTELHLLSDVMIRNRKRLIGGFKSRISHVIPVTPTPAELQLYRDLGEFVREAYRGVPDRQRFIVGYMLVGYQKRLTSCIESFCQTLERRIDRLDRGEVTGGSINLAPEAVDEQDLDTVSGQLAVKLTLDASFEESIPEARILRALLHQARQLPRDSKFEALEALLDSLVDRDASERIVIFTQFVDTLHYLASQIQGRWTVVTFHGGQSAGEKDEAIAAFQAGNVQILLTTEAGGEGRNLQVASVLINYDLPWNPMKVEQRIGRLDRIGQTRDVHIYSFAMMGTVEERVIDVLDRRIHAFEETVGGLDPILGSMERDIQALLLESVPEKLEEEFTTYADRIDVATLKARQADEVLRDFALDRRSFDSKLREAFDSVEHARIQRHANKFSKSLLKQVGAELKPIGDDIFRVRLGKHLTMPLPEGMRETFQITFNQHQALAEDLVEFGTFGHPLFDTMIEWVTSEDFRAGPTTIRTVISAEHGDFRGFQFNFLVTISSLRETQKLLVVAVDLEGNIRPDLSELLLDTYDWRNSQLPFSPKDIPDWSNLVSDALLQAETWLDEQLAKEREERLSRRRDEHAIERRKLDRYCSHREQEGLRKINHDEMIVSRLQSSDREEDRKVIPIWERTVRNSRASLIQTREECARLTTELDRRASISYSYELLNAAWVQIVSPSQVSDSKEDEASAD